MEKLKYLNIIKQVSYHSNSYLSSNQIFSFFKKKIILSPSYLSSLYISYNFLI